MQNTTIVLKPKVNVLLLKKSPVSISKRQYFQYAFLLINLQLKPENMKRCSGTTKRLTRTLLKLMSKFENAPVVSLLNHGKDFVISVPGDEGENLIEKQGLIATVKQKISPFTLSKTLLFRG